MGRRPPYMDSVGYTLLGGAGGLEEDRARPPAIATPPPARRSRASAASAGPDARTLSSGRASAASAACPSDRAAELREVIEACEAREVECRAVVFFWERCWERHRKPVVDRLEVLDHEKESAVAELNAELDRIRGQEVPLPPGPRCLSWVESDWFGALCNAVVALNLAGMAFGGELHGALGGGEVLLDHAYLAWYVVELSIKALYYQRELLCGPVSVVWWNWMDMLIVASGVAEQWVIPILTFTGVPGVKLNLSMLRGLRFLRFLRVLRALKLVRVFVQGDFKWVQSSTYEIIGTVILGINSLTMAIELDNSDWRWWNMINSLFLAFYTFDIVCRLKLQGLAFFYDRDTLGWNYLDLVVVTEGVVDQWAVPCARAAMALLSGEPAGHDEGSSAVGILKMLRLLRILRLARLCRSIPPLYRLLQGVAEALGGLRWVMVLTFLVIYSGAIVFTTMVTQDMIPPVHDEEVDTIECFGTVPRSLYSLFTIMTGELGPSEALTGAVAGQLALVGFMICSNWAILAILTSVVSDNMITSSREIAQIELQQRQEADIEASREKLAVLFGQIDDDGSGSIDEDEWEKRVMADDGMVDALCAAVTSLGREELKDAFEAVQSAGPTAPISTAHAPPTAQPTRRQITFEEFAQYLVKDSQVKADKRSILKIREQLANMEGERLETRKLIDGVSSQLAELSHSSQFYHDSKRSGL